MIEQPGIPPLESTDGIALFVRSKIMSVKVGTGVNLTFTKNDALVFYVAKC